MIGQKISFNAKLTTSYTFNKIMLISKILFKIRTSLIKYEHNLSCTLSSKMTVNF